MARKPMLSRRALVQITRDNDNKVPRVVWQHEIPILETVFGEGNVIELPSSTLDDGYSPKASADMLPYNKRQDQIQKPSESAGLDFVFFGNKEAEYSRLASAYGKCADVDMLVVERCYGRFAEGRFERVLGDAEFDDMPDAQLRVVIMDHGYLPIIAHDSSDDEKRRYDEARRHLFSLAHTELVKLAEEVAGALA